MKVFPSITASAAIVAIAASTISPAFAQHRDKRVVHKSQAANGRHVAHVARRHVVARQKYEPIPRDYVAQAPVYQEPVYSAAYPGAPLIAGAAVGTTAGVLVANSSDVASALGAGTTIGAGLGFGAIFGAGTIILYCAIAKPHQECF